MVNLTSDDISELVILSFSGSLKSFYRGQKSKKHFTPSDIVCDSGFNIIVSDIDNRHIHILSPAGEFLKNLQNDNEVTCPSAMSLYKSTLWVGNERGHIHVFLVQYIKRTTYFLSIFWGIIFTFFGTWEKWCDITTISMSAFFHACIICLVWLFETCYSHTIIFILVSTQQEFCCVFKLLKLWHIPDINGTQEVGAY